MFKINKTYTLVVFILCIGIALRAQELISHNFLFLLDQGRDMMAVKGILYDNHPTLIGPSTSLRGVFQGPLWYYLLALSTGIFDGDPWGGIVLVFIISVAVLFIIYFWTKKLFGDKAAITTLFLFAVSPEAASAASFAWNPHPMWILIVVYIFTSYSTFYKSNKLNILLWPTIGLMFHFQTALAVFILASTIIYIFIFERQIVLNKNFLIGVVLFLFTFIPQILFEARHDFFMSKSALSLLGGSERGLFTGGEKSSYLNLVNSHIYSFSSNFRSAFINDGIARRIPDLFILLVFSSILLIKKKVNIFLEKESNFILFMVKLLLIIFLLTFAYPFPLRSWFLTGFQSFYLIILGLLLSKLLIDRLGKAFVVLTFVVLTFYSWQRIDVLYFHPPNDGGIEKIRGKLSAIDYVYKDANGKPFGLLVFTPPVYTYAYDYLIWWHSKKNYNYIPYQDKKGTFYLLIEPDPHKSWTYKGWLETVIKSGDIVYTKTLPSGHMVQKRFERI